MDPDPSTLMTETLAQNAEVFSVMLRHKRLMREKQPQKLVGACRKPRLANLYSGRKQNRNMHTTTPC